jgi:hypothetical protein
MQLKGAGMHHSKKAVPQAVPLYRRPSYPTPQPPPTQREQQVHQEAPPIQGVRRDQQVERKQGDVELQCNRRSNTGTR